MTTAPTPSIFEPARLGPLTLRNRIVKAATFEGVMPRGAVSDDLINFHAEVARGGAAMTTVAYCAVSPGGRVHRDTLVMDERALPGLRRLTDAVHAEGALAAAQIGHAGLVANTLSNKTKTLAPSTRLSPPAMGLVKGATLAELDGVVSDFERTAHVAVDAGFDAIEVHLGHNYLLSSFMSPNLNKRHDRYGGSVAKRAEYPRRVVEAVRRAAGSSVAVTAKFNMSDGGAERSVARPEPADRPDPRSRRPPRRDAIDRWPVHFSTECTSSAARSHWLSLSPPNPNSSGTG